MKGLCRKRGKHEEEFPKPVLNYPIHMCSLQFGVLQFYFVFAQYLDVKGRRQFKSLKLSQRNNVTERHWPFFFHYSYIPAMFEFSIYEFQAEFQVYCLGFSDPGLTTAQLFFISGFHHQPLSFGPRLNGEFAIYSETTLDLGSSSHL